MGGLEPGRDEGAPEIGGEGVDVLYRVTDEHDGLVTFETHHRFADGTALVSPSTLRFRSHAEIATGLADAGFTVVEWFGDWTGEPLTSAVPRSSASPERSDRDDPLPSSGAACSMAAGDGARHEPPMSADSSY